jgi:hypothetical protein
MAPYEISTRAQIVTLKAIGQTTAEVIAVTGLAERTIQSIYSRAVERGFDPAVRPIIILDHYVKDAPRSGRPKRQIEEGI